MKYRPADITYFIAHAISNNRSKRLDLSETKEKPGYNPRPTPSRSSTFEGDDCSVFLGTIIDLKREKGVHRAQSGGSPDL